MLCAGLGTRLRPLTLQLPKPAVPFLGRPLIRYTLATLARAGIKEVGFNTHHLPEVMELSFSAACAAEGLAAPVRSHEELIQGTGGGIRGLASLLSGGVSVVLNGDVLFAVELAPILAAHVASKAIATMVLLPMPPNEKFNPVEVNAKGEVRRIAGVGPGGDRLVPWHFSGAHVLSPEIFEFMTPGAVEDINRDVYPRAIAAGRVVRAQLVQDPWVFWSDVGTPARYLDAHQAALSGKWSFEAFGSASPFAGMKRDGLSWVHPDAAIAGARFAGPAWFGARATVASTARLGAFVSIGEKATVRPGAMINRVAVLDGAQVPEGVLLEDCIVSGDGELMKREP